MNLSRLSLNLTILVTMTIGVAVIAIFLVTSVVNVQGSFIGNFSGFNDINFRAPPSIIWIWALNFFIKIDYDLLVF